MQPVTGHFTDRAISGFLNHTTFVDCGAQVLFICAPAHVGGAENKPVKIVGISADVGLSTAYIYICSNKCECIKS
jgi:hypothetical protein